MYFYELLAEFNNEFKAELRVLYKEANELLAVTISSINTTLKNMEIEKNKLTPNRNLKS